MMPSRTCTRRSLLNSALGFTLLSFVPSGVLAQDVAAAPLTVTVDGWTLTLRMPAAGVIAGEESIFYLRVTQAGADTVPFARIDAKATPDGGDKPTVSFNYYPGGVAGEYALAGTFDAAGGYSLSVTVRPPDNGGKPIEAKFAGVTVRPAEQRGKALESPFTMKIDAVPSQPLPGEAVNLRISFTDTRTRKRVTDFEPIYDAPLHLYIVREDIGDMRHILPLPINAASGSRDDGVFQIAYSFPTGGTWRIFAEVAPKGEGEQLLSAKIGIPGSRALAEQMMAQVAPLIRQSGLTMRLERPTRMLAHQTIEIPILLQDSQGEPVGDLQLQGGALAHLYFVDRDGKAFVHAVPDRNDPSSGRVGTGLLTFPAYFPKAGIYRAWLTVLRGTQTITVTFVIKVADK